MSNRLTTLFLLAMLTLSGCSSIPFFGDEEEPESETEGYTEKDFYDVIQRNLNSSHWEDAIANLQALEAQFPFGNYAEQAQLELIYVYHRSTDYDAAINAAERFIRLHPRHPNVDYAYYIKGLAFQNQSKSFLAGFSPTDNTSRDPGTARDSFAAFSELVRLYPNSTYSADARKRMIYLRNLLARYELHAANYYFERGAYVAAANRGRYVLENFQQTPAVPDALAIMAEAYHLIGKEDLANDASTVLAANYPDYPSLDAAGNFQYQGTSASKKTGWLRGLFDSSQPPRYDSREYYSNGNPESFKERLPEVNEKRSLLNKLTFGLLGE